jgi:uncharacterized protein YndB with AHSA1/START domain
MAALDQLLLSLEISRRFEAPPARVFDAWLSDEWGDWLPPAEASCKILALDPVEGGRFHLRMTMGDGRKAEIGGVYREIKRPTKLVLTWTGGHNRRETVITVTFHKDGDGTLMTLRQDNFLDAGSRDGYQAGWTGPGGSFDKLVALLAQRIFPPERVVANRREL